MAQQIEQPNQMKSFMTSSKTDSKADMKPTLRPSMSIAPQAMDSYESKLHSIQGGNE